MKIIKIISILFSLTAILTSYGCGNKTVDQGDEITWKSDNANYTVQVSQSAYGESTKTLALSVIVKNNDNVTLQFPLNNKYLEDEKGNKYRRGFCLVDNKLADNNVSIKPHERVSIDMSYEKVPAEIVDNLKLFWGLYGDKEFNYKIILKPRKV